MSRKRRTLLQLTPQSEVALRSNTDWEGSHVVLIYGHLIVVMVAMMVMMME